MSEHLTDLPRFTHTNEDDGRQYELEIVESTFEDDRVVEIKFNNQKSYEEGHVFEIPVYDVKKTKPKLQEFIVVGFDAAYAIARRLETDAKDDSKEKK